MKIRIFMALKAETVRAFQNLQWPHVGWAIVKRNPDSKALRISVHESVVLMRMNSETLAMRENQPAYGFGVDQDMLASKHVHDMFKGGMMWQCVKRFQIEDFLVSSLERWVRITACRFDIGYAFMRVMTGQQPACRGEYSRNVTERIRYGNLRQ
jgi:hypothetical protein